MSRQHARLSRLLVASGLALGTLAFAGCGEAGEPTGPMALWDIQPRAGATAGEQPVMITGENFRQDIGYAVYFGSLRATAVTIMDTSTLVVVTPQHEAGPVDVVVAAENGPAFRVQQAFTFADQGGNVMQQVGQGQQAPERF
ncbi:MAG: IPT/TIG domain-containing protein [Sandaracinaceae bacterium]|nr:IPT/TIG domain-containing protein [Sandaracinaceae bacterium]